MRSSICLIFAGVPAPCFTELPEFLCRWPFGRAVEGQGQAVFGEVHGCRHEIVDGREPCFALNIVIDDPKILQMRVAIAKRAVKRNQDEELFHILVDMGELANCANRFITDVS